MGIESRDYLRESSGPSGYGGGGVTTVWKKLIIATVGVFVLQMFLGPSLLNWLALSPSKVVHGQVWRLVTYAFCHDVSDSLPLHILFNMLFLWWFGRTLEAMYGSREFLLFYLTAAVISGCAFVGLGLFKGDLSPAIGASGAVMAVTMVYAMHFPRQKLYIWGIFPVEIRWLVAFYVVADLWGGLAAGVDDGIAHSAHLGGLAFGFFYKKFDLRLDRLWGRLRKPRWNRVVGPRRKIRIYNPSRGESKDDLEQKVDAILEKIHKQGEESLTDREREILKTASHRYKNR